MTTLLNMAYESLLERRKSVNYAQLCSIMLNYRHFGHISRFPDFRPDFTCLAVKDFRQKCTGRLRVGVSELGSGCGASFRRQAVFTDLVLVQLGGLEWCTLAWMPEA